MGQPRPAQQPHPVRPLLLRLQRARDHDHQEDQRRDPVRGQHGQARAGDHQQRPCARRVHRAPEALRLRRGGARRHVLLARRQLLPPRVLNSADLEGNWVLVEEVYRSRITTAAGAGAAWWQHSQQQLLLIQDQDEVVAPRGEEWTKRGGMTKETNHWRRKRCKRKRASEKGRREKKRTENRAPSCAPFDAPCRVRALVCVVWLSSLLLRVFLCPMRRAVAARVRAAPSLCVGWGLRLCVSTVWL